MKPRPLPAHVTDKRAETVALANGSTLTVGDEFTIKGTPQSDGRYSFRYGQPSRLHGFDVTCYGPVGKKDQSTRTFSADRVRTIHRKKIEREKEAA